MTFLKEQLLLARVLPVLIVNSEEEAVALCRALQAGGMSAVEITLRTPAALAAIKAVKQTLPDLTVAAGTVISTRDMENVAEAGVDFAVSPGLTRSLSECAQQLGLNFLPGVSTASEIMGGMELGHRLFKFFPAEASGGVKLLKAFESPFAGISFCPTGGVNTNNARSYFDLGNVSCVGGSWMIEEEIIKKGRWSELTQSVCQCLAELAPTG
ncbi:MAG: bifunctional 4-hydroxy-2-oxoglutarate aldolase/2-dehydro-3-deoxy-phosphogluconate aldolase [Pseudohongiella sp.]|nr:bifunctional 4-hydroxy-2-oxoglutarate aldolase/2-dehydro-3-deoxy-phosphogluconate aldolase [Pseudohongiella sp.]